MSSRPKYLILALVLALALVCVLGALSRGTPVAAQRATVRPAVRFASEPGVYLPPGERVRVLCFAERNSSSGPFADVVVTVGAGGQAQLPAGCTFLAALHELVSGPAHRAGVGPAYWIYGTSFAPNAPGLVDTRMGTDVLVPPANELLLFNLVTSVAWGADEAFVGGLRSGLRLASNYLYDVSEGRMAFGPLAIHRDGVSWETADLRFKAANDFRPAAYVGGIVPNRVPYASSAFTETVYAPGATLYGRYWDGARASGTATSTWTMPAAYRTIVHEWGHYALFLYDEYLGVTGHPAHCTDPANRDVAGDAANASIMDYHYTSSELWLSGLPKGCAQTVQWAVHGRSDWETLAIWRQLQGLGGSYLTPVGAIDASANFDLVTYLFARGPGHTQFLPVIARPGTAPLPTVAADVELSPTWALARGLPAQLYLLEGETAAPARILYQGSFLPGRTAGVYGEMGAVGIRPDDFARAFVDVYTTGVDSGSGATGSYGGDTPLLEEVADGPALAAVPNSWPVTLDVTFGFDGPALVEMTATVHSRRPLFGPLTFQLCVPDAAIGCASQWTLTDTVPLPGSAGGEVWSATFTPHPAMNEVPSYGVVRVQAPNEGEIMRWFQIAGGVGPAHEFGDAPLNDGLAMVNATRPVAGPCNRFIYSSAYDYAARVAPMSNENAMVDVRNIVGPPLDLDIYLPQAGGVCPPAAAAGDRTLPVPVVLTLFYNEDMVNRLGVVDEGGLEILHYRRGQGQGVWERVPVQDRDDVLNWVSTVIEEDGIYAVVELQ